MQINRFSSTCFALIAPLLLVSGLSACSSDDSPSPAEDAGKPDTAADTSTGSPDAGNADTAGHGDVSGDFAASDVDAQVGPSAPDGGILSACIVGVTSCFEYGLDYTPANADGHCKPNMGTAAATCPETLEGGARIGKCIVVTQFGTRATVYYKRADPTSAMAMCATEMGTWYAN